MILLIDDDLKLCQLLIDYLARENFPAEATSDPEKGIVMALSRQYSMIILDVMMPKMSGFDVLRQIRHELDTPVMMLTGRCEDVDRIIGLELGADDYLSKPFNHRELVARIRAIQRRTDKNQNMMVHNAHNNEFNSKISTGDIIMDLTAREVWKNGKRLDLTSVEFSILSILLKHCGNVVSREELAAKGLYRKYSINDRSIDVHVGSLRRKLGRKIGDFERIKGVRGIGYMYTYCQNPEELTEETPCNCY